MINIAIMGYGTIGSGVAKIIDENRARIAKNAEEEINLKYVLDLREFENDPIFPKIIHDYMTIVNDPDVSVVVETMGGVEPAFTFVKAMLESGKHVVTSNKALVADKGPELISIAEDNGVNFFFEASVGGGIPIIRPLLTSITGDEIDEISGIVNGTTNYILTKMLKEGTDFDEALKQAQELGYAEKDPSADIEGADACRKIAILTSIVMGKQVNYQDIHTEGITKISAADMRYVKAMGRVVRLLAQSIRTKDGYVALVAPYMVGEESPLYQVNGVFNAIFVRGNMLGDAMFYGSGAGSLPTASAVVGDIIDAVRHIDEHMILHYDAEPAVLVDYRTLKNRFFVRTSAGEEEIKKVFGEDTQIVTVPGEDDERGFITALITEKEYEELSGQIEVISMIRCY